MVWARYAETMPADCDTVFALVHDYERRLRWDTLLRRAYVEGGVARLGAIAVCSGRWAVGGLTMRTAYVSFRPGVVAAVKLVGRTPLFDRWAASIRHTPLPDGRSRIEYTLNFRARPRWLAALLEPVLRLCFAWETRRRLRALASALQRGG